MSDKTPKDDMDIEDPEDMDEGYEASGEDGDFVEEDWESFDEEGQYLDDGDGDGDGGKSARTAAFNRIVIGCAVVGALVVGYYTMFSGKKEDLGHPQMEEVSQAAPVSANDKVEFHAETKVDANDAFGVQYGEEVDKEQEVKPNLPPAGLLNNPGMLGNIRGQIMEPEVAPPPPAPGMPQEVSGDLPMPSPIWSPEQEPAQGQDQNQDQSQGQARDVPGLMPMPGETAAAEKTAADVPRSPDDGAAADPLAAWRANAVTDKVPASAESGTAADMDAMDMEMGMNPDMTAEPDRTPPVAQKPEGMSRVAQAVADRQMDKILQRLDSMEKTLSGIQDRLEDIEHDKASSPVKAAARSEKKSSSSSSVASSSSSTHRKTSSSGTRATTWVLKSAQPGSALLSRKGDSGTVSVSVGQTVQGIGRITSIDRQNGRWVVQGTNGSVNQ